MWQWLNRQQNSFFKKKVQWANYLNIDYYTYLDLLFQDRNKFQVSNV